MKNTILSLLALTSTLLFAGQLEPDIQIHVKGLVCDFCARSVDKTFGKLNSVKDISVDLEQGLISLSLKEDKDLSDEKIEKLIKANGFSLESIERLP